MVSSTYPIWGSGSIWDTNLVLIAQQEEGRAGEEAGSRTAGGNANLAELVVLAVPELNWSLITASITRVDSCGFC